MRRPNTAPKTVPIELLPPDVAPLPYGPLDPTDPDHDEHIRSALYLHAGNTIAAARELNIPPGSLARRIENSPSLKADREVARRLIVDLAEQNIIEALSDEEQQDRRDDTARFVLTSLGKQLGWGTGAVPAMAGVSLSDGAGRTLSVKWQNDGE